MFDQPGYKKFQFNTQYLQITAKTENWKHLEYFQYLHLFNLRNYVDLVNKSLYNMCLLYKQGQLIHKMDL